MYAFAPSWIAADISRMRSLPAGCLRIHCVDITPNRMAITPEPIESHRANSLVIRYLLKYCVEIE
jgi:hypothetical protein